VHGVNIPTMRARASAPRPRGRLRTGLVFWLSLGSALVAHWVEHGFPLVFVAGPPAPHWQPNHSSALSHGEFVDQAVAELLDTGAACVWDATEAPTCVSPLGVVPKAGGKHRLILDLRYVNRHLRVPSFKYEGLEAVHTVLSAGDWMVTLDLRAGYHHVDMALTALPYLAFSWRGTTYTFLCLPFGLATAPWAFTKITRRLVSYFRGLGVPGLGYIDDFLFAAPSCDRATYLVHSLILPTFQAAGLQLSEEKCQLIPATSRCFLGVVVDTARGSFLIPSDKRDKLLTMIRQALAGDPCPARCLAAITGRLQSMRWAFGPLVAMFTRECYTCLRTAAPWETCNLSAACGDELRFLVGGF
jgi:hypothetical protein